MRHYTWTHASEFYCYFEFASHVGLQVYGRTLHPEADDSITILDIMANTLDAPSADLMLLEVTLSAQEPRA